jgi:hypothetical protein
MTRPKLRAVVASLLLPLLTVGPAAQASAQKELRFQVFLDDDPIGEHSFEIAELANGLKVESRAAFDVDFLFLNVYRYRHQSDEVWRDGCLHEIRAETNENGKRYRVEGELDSGRFVVQGDAAKQQEADGCIMTFAYWNPDFLRAQRLLNPQTGELEQVRSRAQGKEPVRVGDSLVPAARHRLEGDELAIDLWYSDELGWVGLRSEIPEAGTLTYRRM